MLDRFMKAITKISLMFTLTMLILSLCLGGILIFSNGIAFGILKIALIVLCAVVFICSTVFLISTLCSVKGRPYAKKNKRKIKEI